MELQNGYSLVCRCTCPPGPPAYLICVVFFTLPERGGKSNNVICRKESSVSACTHPYAALLAVCVDIALLPLFFPSLRGRVI